MFFNWFCKTLSFKFFLFKFFYLQKFSWNFFLSLQFFFKIFSAAYKFFVEIFLYIFFSENDKRITKKREEENSREIDRREPLPTVDRKLASPYDNSQKKKVTSTTTTVNWTGSANNNLLQFDGGYEMTLVPGGMYMGYPSDISKCVSQLDSFHLELCWMESPGKRQRLVRTYDSAGLAVSSSYFLENKAWITSSTPKTSSNGFVSSLAASLISFALYVARYMIIEYILSTCQTSLSTQNTESNEGFILLFAHILPVFHASSFYFILCGHRY